MNYAIKSKAPAKNKKHWWSKETDDAFMNYYFNNSLSHQQKEDLYNTKIYPSMSILAASIIEHSSWHIPLRMSQQDLIKDLITFMHTKAPTYDANRADKSSISSYLCFIASRHVYQTWRSANTKLKKESFSIDEIFGEDDEDGYKWEPRTTKNIDDIEDLQFMQLLKIWWHNNHDKLPERKKYLHQYGHEIFKEIIDLMKKQEIADKIHKKFKINKHSIYNTIVDIFMINKVLYDCYMKDDKLPDLSGNIITDKLHPAINYLLLNTRGNVYQNKKRREKILGIHTKTRMGRPATSQYKGVSYNKKNRKWSATIILNKKPKYMGHFNTELEAVKAYNNAMIKYFGENAPVNKINSTKI